MSRVADKCECLCVRACACACVCVCARTGSSCGPDACVRLLVCSLGLTVCTHSVDECARAGECVCVFAFALCVALAVVACTRLKRARASLLKPLVRDGTTPATAPVLLLLLLLLPQLQLLLLLLPGIGNRWSTRGERVCVRAHSIGMLRMAPTAAEFVHDDDAAGAAHTMAKQKQQ